VPQRIRASRARLGAMQEFLVEIGGNIGEN
jgi:hypothetical protein